MWRGVHGAQGISDVSKFYTPGNVRGLAKIWDEIQKVKASRVREALKFIFTGSALLRTTKMARIGKGPQGGLVPSRNLSGTLYIASITVEKNVWDVFSNKADMVFETITNATLGMQRHAFVITGSATDIQDLPENVVDY